MCSRHNWSSFKTWITDLIPLSHLFFCPGMLKDVEDELQRKVKVFALSQFKPQYLIYYKILNEILPILTLRVK